MEVDMRVRYLEIREVEKEYTIMQMEISIQEIGRMINSMDREHIYLLMERNSLDN